MSEKTVLIRSPLNPVKTKSWRLALICLSACLVSLWATTIHAQQFTIEHAKTELVDQVYRLDASLKYKLSPEAITALENGISLILILDIEVIKSRRYMWNDTIATLEQRYEIQYRALTDQYLLANKNSGAQFVYSTLEDALATLEYIDKLPIIDAHLLNNNEHYMVQIRSSLDFDSLPAPLRLKAYFSGEWWLTSGWYSWDL